MARLVKDAGAICLRAPLDSNFAALVRAIVYQQLAGKAAAAIHGRLVAAVQGRVEPESLIALGEDDFRRVGLSSNKAASLRDLAAKVLDATVVIDPRRLSRMEDESIVRSLTAVRGIGEWTAQMFLLFQLRRLDVWPTGDLGVRRGYGLAWRVPMPSARELEPLGDSLRPYRSVAAWYCWRACELYGSAVTNNAGKTEDTLTR
jgi:DNA-3-methyladenine glycosylase II